MESRKLLNDGCVKGLVVTIQVPNKEIWPEVLRGKLMNLLVDGGYFIQHHIPLDKVTAADLQYWGFNYQSAEEIPDVIEESAFELEKGAKNLEAVVGERDKLKEKVQQLEEFIKSSSIKVETVGEKASSSSLISSIGAKPSKLTIEF